MKRLIVLSLLAIGCGKHGADGQNGTNGVDGTTTIITETAPVNPYSIKEIVPICGAVTTGAELAIKLHNGNLLVSFSNNNQGEFTRLAFIDEGTYRTTDQFQCWFKVVKDTDGTLTIVKL